MVFRPNGTSALHKFGVEDEATVSIPYKSVSSFYLSKDHIYG